MNATPNMSEKELLTDLLNQEKHIISTYMTGVTESSCPNLRKLLSNTMNEIAQDQFCVFDNMQQRGYYKTKPAQPADVQTAKQTFAQMAQQL